jgi:hypothetical protein
MENEMPKTFKTTVVNPADGGRSEVTVQGYEVGAEVMTFNYKAGRYDMERVRVVKDLGTVVMSSYDAWVEQKMVVEFANGDKLTVTSGDVTDASEAEEQPAEYEDSDSSEYYDDEVELRAAEQGWSQRFAFPGDYAPEDYSDVVEREMMLIDPQMNPDTD